MMKAEKSSLGNSDNCVPKNKTVALLWRRLADTVLTKQ
jgi:hypothetical protein